MKFVLFGLGREGRSNYQFIRRLFAESDIILTDDQPLSALNPIWKTILVQDDNTSFAISKELPDSSLKSSILIVAPGIPPAHPLLQKASSLTPITTNTQLFLETCLPDRAKHSILASHLPKLKTQPFVIGVTGTKGKSTTTAGIYHLLQTAKLPSVIGGNIGKPPLDLIPEIAEMSKVEQVSVVLELSSHQLSRVTISPQLAVVQAISPEHLDYYQNFAAYQATKAAITSFQKKSDMVIFNADSKTARQVAQYSPGEKISFGITNEISADYSLIKNHVVKADQPMIELPQLKVRGKHNVLNLMPALIVGLNLHIPTEKIKQALSSFTPLPHRLEYVTTKKEVEYYNDSLSTTPEATMAALDSFPHQQIILIAGGYDRGLNYQPLAQKILQSRVKLVILLPTTGKRIKMALKSAIESKNLRSGSNLKIATVPNLKDAVKLAIAQAQPREVVLMSPASASFNQFKNYAQRGALFKELVNKLNT